MQYSSNNVVYSDRMAKRLMSTYRSFSSNPREAALRLGAVFNNNNARIVEYLSQERRAQQRGNIG